MLHDSPKNRTVVRSQNAVRFTKAALQTAFIFSEELGASLAERLFTSPRRHRRPERERAVLAGARPCAIEVALRSPRWRGERRRLAAWRWGYGPAVLLVHGWEGRGSQLGGFVDPLVRAGLSVVAFDAPGHGDSPGRRLYLTDLADCIVDVARAVGPLHAIVAHSFGAAATLLAHQRGAADAARNVMIAPNAIIDDAVARFARAVALDDHDRGAFEDQLASHAGISVSALGLDRLVGERDAALLVIHDRDDREVPFAHGERLAATWQDARLLATSGLGHRRILRDQPVIAEAVEFIRHGVAPPVSGLVREVDRLLALGGL
ncbi:MAG TPA: alpha/beta fold hydrolase [Kofleriaceae bacterium]|nr:alpha/beta fold hydrolase [Kofleriaceae bacterium]